MFTGEEAGSEAFIEVPSVEQRGGGRGGQVRGQRGGSSCAKKSRGDRICNRQQPSLTCSRFLQPFLSEGGGGGSNAGANDDEMTRMRRRRREWWCCGGGGGGGGGGRKSRECRDEVASRYLLHNLRRLVTAQVMHDFRCLVNCRHTIHTLHNISLQPLPPASFPTSLPIYAPPLSPSHSVAQIPARRR